MQIMTYSTIIVVLENHNFQNFVELIHNSNCISNKEAVSIYSLSFVICSQFIIITTEVREVAHFGFGCY